MRDLLKKTLLLVHLILLCLLLVSAISQYISPEKFFLSSFFSLFFLPLLIINVLFVLFWLIHLKWKILSFSFLIFILIHASLNKSFSFKNKDFHANEYKKSIKILSYNTMLFNYYEKTSKSLDFIAQSDFDIICLQEIGWHKSNNNLLTEKDMQTKLKNYPYRHINISLNGNNKTFGIATFSKFPIIKKENIPIPSSFNSAIYSDILVGKDTIRVFNCHLESNSLTESEKKGLTDEFNSEFVSITAEKLGKASILRAKQANIVSKEIANSALPVIVCGDLNDMPVSYTYQNICTKNKLNDTFLDTGLGIGFTFVDKLLRFRIDYIFTDKNLMSNNYTIEKIKHSDHYPIWCNVYIK